MTDDQIDALIDRHYRLKNHPDSYAALRATIRDALAAQVAPAGMATVPVTPTDDMLIAGQEAWMRTNAHRPAVEDCEQATAVWSAMVAAAPEANT